MHVVTELSALDLTYTVFKWVLEGVSVNVLINIKASQRRHSKKKEK